MEECAVALRHAGATPEAMLITMKAFVRSSARKHPPMGRAPSRWAADLLMEEITTWCIIAFYRTD